MRDSTGVESTRRAQRRLGLSFAVPPFLLFGFFVLYPFVTSIYYSLTDWDGVSPVRNFIGLDNYLRMFSDDQMWNAFRHNLIWVVIGTISPIVIGTTLAIMLWGSKRFVKFLRTAYFLPFVLPTIVVGIVWSWIYNPLFGWSNRALRLIGLERFTRGWLGEPDVALYAVLVAAIWVTTGFVIVIMLTGLQSVNLEMVDAARVDGANSWQRARYVIIPEVMPVLLVITTVLLIGGFAVFDFVFIMTGGGPGVSTEVLGTYTYKMAFRRNEVGYGAALSVLITTVSLPLAIALNRRRSPSA